jgi:hypothetical protein
MLRSNGGAITCTAGVMRLVLHQSQPEKADTKVNICRRHVKTEHGVASEF